ncbi:hypothetical protein niasHT_018650 [Heterodera trifolii]|uniref:Gag protein n=1 Tax=Heterodera trifolii TaxID=157864 RepID=A0ABD2KZ52_9BILA
MSATIRGVLTTAVPKARQNLTTATNLLANDEAEAVELATASEILGKNMETIQRQLDKWGALMAGMSAVARTAEETVFEQYKPGGDSPGELINILAETATHLDLRIDQIKAQIASRQPTPNLAPQGQPNFPPIVPLPTMGLMDFDGTPSRFESFFANFRDNVNSRTDLSPAQKLRYLLGQLKGSARDLTMGYELTDANYVIVKEALTTRYGDEFKRANDLRSELFRLPRASSSTGSLRAFSEAVERICRQLSSLSAVTDDSPYIVTAILDKIPPEIRLKLLEQERDFGTKWTAKQWRSGLSSLVQLREAAHMDREFPRQPNSNGPIGNPRQNGRFVPQNQPRRVFPVVASNKKESANPNIAFFVRK